MTYEKKNFYMQKMLNHTFFKVDSNEKAQNWLQMTINDAFSKPCCFTPYVSGWFIF